VDIHARRIGSSQEVYDQVIGKFTLLLGFSYFAVLTTFLALCLHLMPNAIALPHPAKFVAESRWLLYADAS
jgi:hypothetical protein